MQNKHEVLTMEQLHHLINDACNSIDIAHKTKVKLRKIIKNEEFEFGDLDGIMITGNGDDVLFDFEKVVYMRWSEYFKKAVNGLRKAYKLENAQYLEESHLRLDIECNERKIDDEERRELHDFLEYKFKKQISLSITRLLENRIFFESVEGEFLFDYNEDRQYTTIEGYLNGFGERLFSATEDFCSINKIRLDVREKLLKVAKVHYLLTIIIINDCQRRLVEGSNYVEIVDSFKSQYEEELKVKPREKGFRYYLEGIFEVHNLHLDEVIMRHLAEYVVSEKQKNINFIQEAKEYKQQTIDITPHQTLSIETAAATVEEVKTLDVINGTKIKPSIRAVALYYYFLITKGIELSFDEMEGGKTKAMKDVTDNWEIDNRTFREEWKKVNVRQKRIVIEHYKDYKMAIQLLNKNKSNNNDVIALAKSELKLFAPKG